MSVDAAQIATDLAGIFTDLAGTSASETATIYQPDGVTERGPATILRTSMLRSSELRDAGWATGYRLSVYMLTSADPGAAVNDIVSLSDGDFRLLHIHKGPLLLMTRLDLGDKWGDETA